MRVLAIDPGYDRCGWAVGDKDGRSLSVLEYGCIQTSKTQSFYTRYAVIIQELSSIMQKYNPSVGSLETLFFSKNQKSALRVTEIRGVIITLFIQQKMHLLEYSPQEVKMTVTGHGRADKQAVEKMVRLQLKLNSEWIIDDAIDALAILITTCVLSQTIS